MLRSLIAQQPQRLAARAFPSASSASLAAASSTTTRLATRHSFSSPSSHPSALTSSSSSISSPSSDHSSALSISRAVASKIHSQRYFSSTPLTSAAEEAAPTPDQITPRIHVTPGLSSFHPSSRVFDAISSHAAALLAEQHYSESLTAGEDMSIPAAADASSLESFFVLDLERVRQKHAHWQACLPGITPFYAVKSNPHPAVVHQLAQLGCGFDCASQAEINLVTSLGVTPDRILFAHPCKSPGDILAAKRAGVRRTTFDSEAELLKLHRLDRETELVLRIWVDDRDAQCPLSNKYGATAQECPGLLELAKDLGLKVVGISFHVGSGGRPESFGFALDDAMVAWNKACELGHPMSLIDIGGGFPGTCLTPEQGAANPSLNTASLREIAAVVKPRLDALPPNVSVIAEPGRYFCAESQTLATMVIGKRVRGDSTSYYVGNGVYQSFNCIMFDHSRVLPEPENSAEPMFKSTLFGQTCDGLDQIMTDAMLPQLGVGDWIAFPAMGAYTNTASSTFNGFRLPGIVILQ